MEPLGKYLDCSRRQAPVHFINERGFDYILHDVNLGGGQDITITQIELLKGLTVLVFTHNGAIRKLQLHIFG